MKTPVLAELGDVTGGFADAVADLLAHRVDHGVLTSIDRASAPFDAALWRSLVALGCLDVLAEPTATQLSVSVLAELGYAGLVSPLEPTLIASVLRRRLAGADAVPPETGRPVAVAVPVATGHCRVRLDVTRLVGGPVQVEWLGDAADLLVLARDGEAGYALVSVAPDTPELRATPVRGIDHRRLSVVEFDAVPVRSVLARHLRDGDCENTIAVVQLLRAAVVAGAGTRAAELTARHLVTRVQFGAPLARLQAPRQAVAEMAIELAALTGLVAQAATRVDEGDAVAEHHCRVAAIHAARAGERLLENAAQLHGGIGFMQEHLLHFFYRLGKAEQLHLGGVELLLDTAAKRLLPSVAAGWDWLLAEPRAAS